jgi:hypothetical protein
MSIHLETTKVHQILFLEIEIKSFLGHTGPLKDDDQMNKTSIMQNKY